MEELLKDYSSSDCSENESLKYFPPEKVSGGSNISDGSKERKKNLQTIVERQSEAMQTQPRETTLQSLPRLPRKLSKDFQALLKE